LKVDNRTAVLRDPGAYPAFSYAPAAGEARTISVEIKDMMIPVVEDWEAMIELRSENAETTDALIPDPSNPGSIGQTPTSGAAGCLRRP
jgi:hypothetical protein